MTSLRFRLLTATLPFLLAAAPAGAQLNPPTRAEAQAALNPAPTPFSDPQLDQMLAPIALYPDQLLTQVLMAATFPDQLLDARQWLQDGGNAALRGDALANALQPLPWDPSVKSLVAFPQIIVMMTDHLDWTQALGTAFATQEVQVFARVQFLRDRASAAGVLRSNAQIAVSRQDTDIIIAPASPDEIYVPVYNPADVYGTWPDSDYPPVFLPPPPGFYNGAVGAGIAFSVGFGVVAPLWGWGHPDWHRHEIVVDPGRYQRITSPGNFARNHITVQDQVWHRTAPVALVPEARRPHPAPEPEHLPPGTVRPSQVARPGAPPHPEQHAAPPGATPHPEQHAAPPHPEEQHAAPPGAPPHPEEHAVPPSAPPHPEEHAPPHPEQHAAPPGAPPGAPPRPEQHVAPPPQPPAPPHPEQRAAPPPHPEERAAPPAPPHPEPHPAAPPHPAPHPAGQPAPQEDERH